MDSKKLLEEILISLIKIFPFLAMGALGITTKLIVSGEKISWRKVLASYVVGMAVSYVTGSTLVEFGSDRLIPVACYLAGLTSHNIVQYLLSRKIVEDYLDTLIPRKKRNRKDEE
jgi:hypothetical protein